MERYRGNAIPPLVPYPIPPAISLDRIYLDTSCGWIDRFVKTGRRFQALDEEGLRERGTACVAMINFILYLSLIYSPHTLKK